MPFEATWMDLEIIILSEVSHTEKDKYDITYKWNLKQDTNELIYRTETNTQTQKTYGYQRGEGEGGVNQEFGISRYTLLYIKQVNKVLLYRTGKYSQYLVINYMENKNNHRMALNPQLKT